MHFWVEFSEGMVVVGGREALERRGRTAKIFIAARMRLTLFGNVKTVEAGKAKCDVVSFKSHWLAD